MSLSQIDRKKLVIVAGVVVLALIVLVFVLKGGKRRGRQAGPAGAFPAAGQGTAGTETATAPAPGAPGAQPAAQGEEMAAAAPPSAAMLGPIRIGRGSEVRTRPDPLLTFEPRPVPTPAELVVNPPPVNLRAGGLRPVGVSEIAVAGTAEIGHHRVAGLMFDEGAYAILEDGPGQTFVVKPGDIVQGNRITAIARDSIYLVDPEGRRWQVQLRGKGPGGASLSESGTTIEGMPGSPPEEF